MDLEFIKQISTELDEKQAHTEFMVETLLTLFTEASEIDMDSLEWTLVERRENAGSLRQAEKEWAEGNVGYRKSNATVDKYLQNSKLELQDKEADGAARVNDFVRGRDGVAKIVDIDVPSGQAIIARGGKEAAIKLSQLSKPEYAKTKSGAKVRVWAI